MHGSVKNFIKYSLFPQLFSQVPLFACFTKCLALHVNTPRMRLKQHYSLLHPLEVFVAHVSKV